MSKRFSFLFALIALANVGLAVDCFVKSSEINSLFNLNRLLREKVDELESHRDGTSNNDLLLKPQIDRLDGRVARLFEIVQGMNSEPQKELLIQTILARVKAE